MRATKGHRREEVVIMRLSLGQCMRNSSLKPMGKHHTCEKTHIRTQEEAWGFY